MITCPQCGCDFVECPHYAELTPEQKYVIDKERASAAGKRVLNRRDEPVKGLDNAQMRAAKEALARQVSVWKRERESK